MNVFDRLGFRIGFVFVRRLKPIRPLLLAVWLAGCSGSNSPPTTPLPPESWNDLKQKVALLRELPLKRDGSLTSEPPNPTLAEPEAYVTEEYGAEPLATISWVYKRLGLLPESTNFAAALAEYAKLKRIFYYEARKNLVVITPDAARLARATIAEPNRRPEQIPLVLALTRALQEQHFHWQQKLKRVSVEDRRLAFRALAAGDAFLVASAYLRESQPTAGALDSSQTMNKWATALEKTASHLPRLLQQKLGFPYRESSQFVQWAYAAKGWAGVNALFADPPLSTSQILHPEKYYVKRENPLAIRSSGLARQMKESAVVDQTLGEYLVQWLLTSNLSRQEARQIAAGWTGDQLSAYPEGENPLTAWITAWNKDEDARAFYRAYQNLLQRLHRLRFTASAGRTGSVQAELPGDRLMMLQIAGPLVLLLDGVPKVRALQLTDEIWRHLDAETENTVIPFDSANGSTQLSFRSK